MRKFLVLREYSSNLSGPSVLELVYKYQLPKETIKVTFQKPLLKKLISDLYFCPLAVKVLF